MSDTMMHHAPLAVERHPHQQNGGPTDPNSDCAFDHTFEINCAERYLLHNRTPYLIRIEHANATRYGELLVPPFAERVVSGARLKPFEAELRVHRQRYELRVRPYTERPRFVQAAVVMWASILGLAAVVAYDVIKFGTLRRTEFYLASAVAGLAVFVVLVRAGRSEHRRRKEADMADSDEGDTAYGIGNAYSNGNETLRSASQFLTLALIVAIGALLPAVAIIVATDTKNFMVFEGGLRILPGTESRFVGRVVQIIYTAVLSMFPALLYFQFDRHRVGTIRAQWVRSIFRMDARMRTLADVHARYGHDLSEAANYSTDSVRTLGGKHSPIVLATILIALGWTLLVLRTESFDFSATTAVSQQITRADNAAERAASAADEATNASSAAERTAAAAEAERALDDAETARDQAAAVADESGPPTASDSTTPTSTPATSDGDGSSVAGEPSTSGSVPDDVTTAIGSAREATGAAGDARDDQLRLQSTPFFQLLAPTPSAAAMAFLGAYFYGVYLVLRSYFRGDLRPKIYHQITARLVTVVVIAYLINALLYRSDEQQTVVWVTAFLAGMIPTTMIQRILSMVTAAVGGRGDWMPDAIKQAFDRSRPLTQIDGIDVYDSSRLETEGITDVPALAASDLTSVMVNTRLPIERIVEWADQAALMVVLSSGDEEKLDERISCLRKSGIRTASDFLAACDDKHDDTTAAVMNCLHAAAATDQNGSAGGSTVVARPMTVDDVCAALKRQPVMSRVTQWRNSPLARVDRPWLPLPDPEPASDRSSEAC